MKKALALVLTLAMVGSMSAAALAEDTTEAAEAVTEAAEAEEKSEGVMTYEEYVAAEVDDEVVIEAYVQAKQSWWEEEGVGKASLYTQDHDGAYFIYNCEVSQEDYDLLEEGTKVKVTGYKGEWSGEVEVVDATLEIEEADPYVAEAVDVTDLLGSDELIDYQNQKVTFTGMTVEAAAEDSDAAFLYSWDGSGEQGDDLYFNVSVGGETYTFTVESYLCGADTEVYQAVEALNVGDVIDMEGYLYWYEGVNPHITVVTVR